MKIYWMQLFVDVLCMTLIAVGCHYDWHWIAIALIAFAWQISAFHEGLKRGLKVRLENEQ